MIVRFHHWDCEVVMDTYGYNDHAAIRLNDIRDGGLVTVATMNINEPLEPFEVAINDFDENKGIMQTLIEAEVIAPPKRVVNTGWLKVPICELLVAR